MDQINKQASLGTVTAPCSGTVTAVNVDRGGMASSAQPSVVIAENGAVEVQVSVAEDVFTGIKVGDTAGVTVSAVSKESMNGTVSTLPAAANAQTNLYDVSVSLPSGTKPPIGAFATVTFYTDRRASTISVPTESILTGNNNEQYVFTVNADGTDRNPRYRRPPDWLPRIQTEIVSGLKAGDRVVTKGQSYLSRRLQPCVSSPRTPQTAGRAKTRMKVAANLYQAPCNDHPAVSYMVVVFGFYSFSDPAAGAHAVHGGSGGGRVRDLPGCRSGGHRAAGHQSRSRARWRVCPVWIRSSPPRPRIWLCWSSGLRMIPIWIRQ